MKKCPRCRKKKMNDDNVMNSVSRRKGKSFICNDCGVEEAMIDDGTLNPTENEMLFLEELKVL